MAIIIKKIIGIKVLSGIKHFFENEWTYIHLLPESCMKIDENLLVMYSSFAPSFITGIMDIIGLYKQIMTALRRSCCFLEGLYAVRIRKRSTWPYIWDGFHNLSRYVKILHHPKYKVTSLYRYSYSPSRKWHDRSKSTTLLHSLNRK